MKVLFVFAILVSGLCEAANAGEIVCRYDERARDGGAGLVELKKDAHGKYTVILTRTKNRFGETASESVLFSSAECSSSPTNALLFNCRAGVEVSGIKGDVEIESSISYSPGMGEMLTVVVDPSRSMEQAAGGVAPKLKSIRMPLDACSVN